MKLSDVPEFAYLFEDVVPSLLLFSTAISLLCRVDGGGACLDAFVDRFVEAEMVPDGFNERELRAASR